jgi:hypothetical protein
MDYPVNLTLRSVPTLSGLEIVALVALTLIYRLSRQLHRQNSFCVCAGTAVLLRSLPRVPVPRSGGAEEVVR